MGRDWTGRRLSRWLWRLAPFSWRWTGESGSNWYESGLITIYTIIALVGFVYFLLRTFSQDKPFIDLSLLFSTRISH